VTRRSPNLDAHRVRTIVDVIRRLPGAPTWQRIVRAVGEETGARYTRQALQAHTPIKAMYDVRRCSDPDEPGGPRLSARARAVIERERGYKRRIAELEARLTLYNEKFVLWSHNAHARNLAEQLFQRDLPPLDRARSKRTGKKRGTKPSRR